MQKTRVLAIAPYEGLRELLVSEAAKRDDIELTTLVGDLDAGAELVRAQPIEQYDVILSRGGTAKLIRDITYLPVAEIHLSVYDMIRVIRLACNCSERIGIVGFPSVIERLDTILDLMNIRFETFTIHDASEVPDMIREIRAKGFSLIVGDAIAVRTAKAHQMNGILITSGQESVRQAFKDAVLLHRTQQNTAKTTRIYDAALQTLDTCMVVFSQQGEELFSNIQSDHPAAALKEKLKYDVQKVLQNGEAHLVRRINKESYRIRGTQMSRQDNYSVLFTIQQITEVPLWKLGKVVSDVSETERDFSEPLDNIGAMEAAMHSARYAGQSGQPVWITGENGTDKDDIVRHIHMYSAYAQKLLISYDFAQIDAKQFKCLLTNEQSPLYECGLTLYFKHIQQLPEEEQRDFTAFADATKLHKRCLVAYAAEHGRDGDTETPVLRYLLHEHSACTLIHLPPLRQRKDDIARLASLYIGHFNYILGKQIIGLSPECLQYLEEYPWPGNNAQLKRVLHALVMRSDGHQIDEETIQALLHEERQALQGIPSPLPLRGTMAEIQRAVIQQVFIEENMNQARTARRLDIARSTVWRLLKE